MSWHGPSAPRVEGIATKSLVDRQLRIEAGIDGVEDSLLRIGSHAAAPIGRFSGSTRARTLTRSQPPG